MPVRSISSCCKLGDPILAAALGAAEFVEVRRRSRRESCRLPSPPAAVRPRWRGRSIRRGRAVRRVGRSSSQSQRRRLAVASVARLRSPGSRDRLGRARGLVLPSDAASASTPGICSSACRSATQIARVAGADAQAGRSCAPDRAPRRVARGSCSSAGGLSINVCTASCRRRIGSTVGERLREPVAQPPRAHRRDGAVQRAVERARCAARRDAAVREFPDAAAWCRRARGNPCV